MKPVYLITSIYIKPGYQLMAPGFFMEKVIGLKSPSTSNPNF